MVHGAAGGIRQLCELIDEHGDELEADFRQFYALDIADVWRGRITPRHALVLAGQLSSEPYSRYRAVASGFDNLMGWGRAEQILADLNDAIGDNSIVTIKAAGGKARTPERYPRPAAKALGPIQVDDIDDFPIHLVVRMTSGGAPTK